MKWLLLLALIIPSVAQAHPVICGKYVKVAASLKAQHHERKTHQGLANNFDKTILIVEIWQSKGNGESTFTVVTIHPNGLACLSASGRSLEYLGRDKDNAI
jgi:hypothetical protein